MKCCLLLLFIPTLLSAQDFPFEQEFDTIPVEINGWEPFVPWMYGFSNSRAAFGDIDIDGDYDLLIGTFSGQLFVFQNNGSLNEPVFGLLNSEIFPIDTLEAKVCPEIYDLNADGDDDFIFSDDRGVIKYYENLSSPPGESHYPGRY
jgi:hypothetical protein